jgi:prepilin signal peptidase PulO-like enzyme (type II secretory pathway)
LIIGLIQTGKEKNGIKFIPPLMLGALTVFLLARYVVGYFFGSLFII